MPGTGSHEPTSEAEPYLDSRLFRNPPHPIAVQVSRQRPADRPYPVDARRSNMLWSVIVWIADFLSYDLREIQGFDSGKTTRAPPRDDMARAARRPGIALRPALSGVDAAAGERHRVGPAKGNGQRLCLVV